MYANIKRCADVVKKRCILLFIPNNSIDDYFIVVLILGFLLYF